MIQDPQLRRAWVGFEQTVRDVEASAEQDYAIARETGDAEAERRGDRKMSALVAVVGALELAIGG